LTSPRVLFRLPFSALGPSVTQELPAQRDKTPSLTRFTYRRRPEFYKKSLRETLVGDFYPGSVARSRISSHRNITGESHRQPRLSLTRSLNSTRYLSNNNNNHAAPSSLRADRILSVLQVPSATAELSGSPGIDSTLSTPVLSPPTSPRSPASSLASYGIFIGNMAASGNNRSMESRTGRSNQSEFSRAPMKGMSKPSDGRFLLDGRYVRSQTV
jgi:hypothetical protein